jgi:poly(A) polymerase
MVRARQSGDPPRPAAAPRSGDDMHGRQTDLSLADSPETDDHDDAPRGSPPPGLALDPPEDPPLDHPPEIPADRLDPDAIKVIQRLRHMRHKAYFVGGCVRDLLLGAKPKDFDLATDAHPGEVRAIFRNCRLIGRRFRLAHVYFRGGKVIEVATFRKNPVDVGEDVPDGSDLLITRDNVFGTAEEDAVRRDFTVNGLFYDVASGEVIDYVGGRADLEARRIATIGEPEIRMREDPVRALRAIRFAARLGFTIAPDTFEAMRRHAGELARCAQPRLLEEMFKILRCGNAARAFELLRAAGALPVVLPALGAALEGWDDAGRRGFFAHLAALDRLVRKGVDVSEAVLLGALLMHLGTARLREGGPPRSAGTAPLAPARDRDDAASPPPVAGRSPAPPPLSRGEGVSAAEVGDDLEELPSEDADAPPASPGAEALLAGLVTTARLPRKIAERTRLALHAQKLLREPPRKRRRRGRGLAGQPYFEDALHLLRISVEATGEGLEHLNRWSARSDELRGQGRGGEPGERHGRGEGRPAGDRPAREGRSGRGPRDGRDGRRAGAAAAEAEVRTLLGEAGPRHGDAPDAGPVEVRAFAAGRDAPAAGEAIEVDAAPGAAPSAGEASPEGAAGGRRRRRRRGGRRRRRRGAAGDAPAEGGAAPPVE